MEMAFHHQISECVIFFLCQCRSCIMCRLAGILVAMDVTR